jgi:SAM domain (Sterile alpha motif)
LSDIRRWNTEQLIQHLKGQFLDDLDNEDLKILKDQKIRGRVFLTLTEEKLERYGMKGGPAGAIAGYIDELKGT